MRNKYKVIICVILVAAVIISVAVVVRKRGPKQEPTSRPESYKTFSETTTKEETTTENETVILTTTQIISKRPENESTRGEKRVNAALGSVYMGKFKITLYTPYEDHWGYQTATGVRSEHLRTCAVDPSVIPLGSVIVVGGIELKAVDVGGAVRGNHVDIFFDGHNAEARAWLDDFGESADVYLIEG